MIIISTSDSVHDRLVGRLFVFGAMAVAAVVVYVLGLVVKGRKRPYAYASIAFGFALMLPMLLTEAWGVLDPHTIPESVSVPTFLIGAAIFVIGLCIFGLLFKLGME